MNPPAKAPPQSLMEKQVAAGFSLALVVSLSVGVIQYRTIQNLVATDRWVEDTLTGLAELEEVYADLQEADADMRGYVATRKEAFAEECEADLSHAIEHLRVLSSLTAGHPRQRVYLGRLISLTDRKLVVMRPVLAPPENQDLAVASQLLREGQALMLTNEIRPVVEEMKAESNRLLADRVSANRAGARKADIAIALGAALALALIGAASWLDRRHAADRQRAEEERSYLASIVESSEDAIVGRDVKGTIVSWNPSAQRIFGYSAEEAIGLPAAMLIPPELRSEPAATPEGSRRGHSVHHYETVRVRKDRERIHVAVTVSPIKGPLGEITGTSAISHDITVQKRAESLLQLRTEALEAAANGIAITDRDGVIVWCNEALSRLTGYDADELLGRNPRILKSGKHDPVFYENMWRTILDGKVWRGEIINRRKDGSLYPLEMTITPVRESDGAIKHFIAIKQDITERKRAEEEIKKLNEGLERRVAERTAELITLNQELEREISERKIAEKALEELQQRTELVLNSAGEGILGMDLEGKCTFANPAAQQMLGYTREELIGQDVHFLARHSLDDGRLCNAEECGICGALSRGVVYEAEDQVVHSKNGTPFPIDEIITPVVQRGEIVGAVVTFRDVSERRLVENMKNEFVSVVSHELRTPLTAIRGSLGLLAKGELGSRESPRARRMLEIAREQHRPADPPGE